MARAILCLLAAFSKYTNRSVWAAQIPMYQHPPGRQAEYAPDGTPIPPPRDRTTEVLQYSFCLSVCLSVRFLFWLRAVDTPRCDGSSEVGMSMLAALSLTLVVEHIVCCAFEYHPRFFGYSTGFIIIRSSQPSLQISPSRTLL